MIAIVDYGMGNLRSVQKAFESLGFQSKVTQDPKEIASAQKVVFPGVGAFGDCMSNLQSFGLYDCVRNAALSGKPFLGICLGLQALFEESEEGGLHKGLGLIKGRVERFNVNLKIPHMGWNRISLQNPKKNECPILKGVPDQSYFYFVHSYYVSVKEQEIVAARTEYEIDFVSMIWKENLFATQFHPEKSQAVGLRILKNFAELS